MGELLLTTARPASGSIAAVTGLVLGAFGIGGLLYAASVRVLLRLFGVRRMCLIGSGAAALCYAALAFVPTWWLAALAMFVAGVSFYMLHNSLQTEATELAPSARGSAVALFACGFFIGQGLGPLVFGALLHGLGRAAGAARGRRGDRRARPGRRRPGHRSRRWRVMGRLSAAVVTAPPCEAAAERTRWCARCSRDRPAGARRCPSRAGHARDLEQQHGHDQRRDDAPPAAAGKAITKKPHQTQNSPK